MGGLAISPQSECVYEEDSRVIPGLYAAGELAGTEGQFIFAREDNDGGAPASVSSLPPSLPPSRSHSNLALFCMTFIVDVRYSDDASYWKAAFTGGTGSAGRRCSNAWSLGGWPAALRSSTFTTSQSRQQGQQGQG